MSQSLDQLAMLHLTRIAEYADLIKKICLAFNQRMIDKDEDVISVRSDLDAIVFYSFQIKGAVWPNPRGAADPKLTVRRGEEVRLRLGINEGDFADFKAQNMRNDIVHFDQRIDKWYKESRNHNSVGFILGPRGVVSGLERREIFQQFVPEKKVYIFTGKEMDLQRTVDDALEVGRRARAALTRLRGPGLP